MHNYNCITKLCKIKNFILGVFKMVVQVCHTAMLITWINISHLMEHAKRIEEEKIK